jgi:lipopolysaccharide heptosyltransferase II
MTEQPNTYRRILVTRLKFIGDVVLTTPLIRTLHETFPDAEISYLGERNAVSLLEHNPFLTDIIPVDFSTLTLPAQVSLYARLHSRGFDCVIDLFSNPRSALLAFATGAATRVGADRRGRGMLYTVRVTDDGKPKSAIDFHYQSLRAIGIEPRSFITEIYLTDGERQWAADYCASHGIAPEQKIVVLQCGGTWPAKLWDKDRFAALGVRCSSEPGCAVVLTGGGNDREVVSYVHERVPGSIDAVGLTLRQLAALLSRASVMVSNDCGAMHIAVAVSTPTIGIFGPGEDDIWFPYTKQFYGDGAPHRALRKDVPCHPCHLDLCTRTGQGYMECMRLLSVDDVFTAVKEIV